MGLFRTFAELVDTTQDQLLPGLYNGLINIDEATASFIALSQLTDRPSIKGNRVVSEGTADYVNCNDTITPQAISGSPFSYDLLAINRSFDVCVTASNLNSTFTDVVSSEIQGAISAIGKKLGNDLMVGSGSGQLAGLASQISYTVAQATAGAGNLDLSDLDNLMDLVRTSGPKVLIGGPAAVNRIKSEIRASAGGETTAMVQGTSLVRPSFEGIPILKSQYVASGTLHLVDVNEFQVYFGVSDDANVGGVFNLLSVGALETKLMKRWHLYVQAASVLLNTRGAASLTGIA